MFVSIRAHTKMGAPVVLEMFEDSTDRALAPVSYIGPEKSKIVPKRTRVVEEGEEARGPKRPRRPRVPEGAYKQTATRERREPEEERERKIRKCAVVPVGSEALKRMEERQ